jgi:Uri superfamily endonuclease
MKGVYLLLLQLDESQQISVGRLGMRHFSKGFYAYVGSALNGIEPRVSRHLSNDKKHFWHIDYLLDKARVFEVVLIPTEEKLECTLAMALKEKLLCISRFGSSDCDCQGHLFLLLKDMSLRFGWKKYYLIWVDLTVIVPTLDIIED